MGNMIIEELEIKRFKPKSKYDYFQNNLVLPGMFRKLEWRAYGKKYIQNLAYES